MTRTLGPGRDDATAWVSGAQFFWHIELNPASIEHTEFIDVTNLSIKNCIAYVLAVHVAIVQRIVHRLLH